MQPILVMIGLFVIRIAVPVAIVLYLGRGKNDIATQHSNGRNLKRSPIDPEKNSRMIVQGGFRTVTSQ